MTQAPRMLLYAFHLESSSVPQSHGVAKICIITQIMSSIKSDGKGAHSPLSCHREDPASLPILVYPPDKETSRHKLGRVWRLLQCVTLMCRGKSQRNSFVCLFCSF